MKSITEKNDDALSRIENGGDNRKPIFRQLLAPFIFFLKIFGLYFECTNSSKKSKLSRGYSYFVITLLFAQFARGIAALFYHSSTDEYYLSYLVIVFNIKCALNGLSCLHLSPLKKCRSKLWSFIEDLEKFLEDVKLSGCEKKEHKFKRKIRVWVYIFAIFGVLNTFVQCFNLFGFRTNSEFSQELHNMTVIIARPFPSTVAVSVIDIILFIFGFAAWFLPAALCGILSQCLSYCFDELYRYLKRKRKECPLKLQTVCLQSFIRGIRLKYLRLSDIAHDLDKMVKYLYLFSYLFDIVMICLILRIAIINFHDWISRTMILVWCIPPLFTLLALSYYSSEIIEKASTMHSFIQHFEPHNVDVDTQVELSMFLFQLSNEPVVLTIWGMIPLYRSIIISIFVSIITYFALLLSF